MIPPAFMLAAALEAQPVRPPPPAPAVHARLLTPRLFRDDDYPTEAMRYRVHGLVRYFIVISATGRVVHCRVVRSSGWTLLDDTTCALIRERARFEPARDAAGNPMVDTSTGSVDWRMPQPAPAPRV
jgi:protein TonB